MEAGEQCVALGFTVVVFYYQLSHKYQKNKKLKPKNLNLLYNKDNLNYTKSVCLYTYTYICMYIFDLKQN